MAKAKSLSALIVGISMVYGCSHTIHMTGRTTGVTGSAKVADSSGSGPLSIQLGPRTFSGRWVYLAQGGGVSFGSGQAFLGAQTASFASTGITLPSGGNGSVIASAADGAQLRCNFDYSEMSGAGLGVCQDSLGETYDLQIN